MRGLGLWSPVPAMCVEPNWSLERRQAVNLRILELRTGAKADRDAFLQGRLQIPARPLKTNVPCTWIGNLRDAALATAPPDSHVVAY
eukprot:2176322-Alexandrium_andersonii.AAC.1